MTWCDGRPKNKRIIIWDDLHWYTGWMRFTERPCRRCGESVAQHSVTYLLLHPRTQQRPEYPRRRTGVPRLVLCRPCGDATETIEPAEVMTLKAAWYRTRAPKGHVGLATIYTWKYWLSLGVGRRGRRLVRGGFATKAEAEVALEAARVHYFADLIAAADRDVDNQNFYDALDEQYEDDA